MTHKAFSKFAKGAFTMSVSQIGVNDDVFNRLRCLNTFSFIYGTTDDKFRE